ncbi:metallophosphoesterase [Zooshikella harenae]|uniref:Metallophosphoesterase n=1 Tax=Zooshikella harenae TaxID=2827238 RepID=A0ABS5ZEM4_9GAMM|nr:metallophosphoesterase [Zooshikella harenae]MBU2712288.1 metallophosphoesterase [Zooshikella harenae]
MKIQLFSDLHLEFGFYQLPKSEADVIILAGDINLGTRGAHWAIESFPQQQIIYVLGNHEYYHHSYPELLLELENYCRGTNIHLLENASFQFENIVFYGATLWTDFNLFGNEIDVAKLCQQRMNDYNYIYLSDDQTMLSVNHTARIHQHSVSWLEEKMIYDKCERALTENNLTKPLVQIVVSHHAPSIHSIPINQKQDYINAAYASNLEWLIKKTQPNYWFHGHIHRSQDYWVDNCRVMSNPRGYPIAVNHGFNEKWIIDV